MISERERAVAALRAWAAPGIRARLIAEAWLAGEHNIAALAQAANVTRQTVYTDLESRGISPRTDRQEARTMQTITLGPFCGIVTDTQFDEHADQLIWSYRQRASAMAEDSPAPDSAELVKALTEEMQTYHHQYTAVRYHNTLVPFIHRVQSARESAGRALHRVETAWAALSTARSWHAAHHSYVQAVHEAREAAQTWVSVAQELTAKDAELRRELPAVDAAYPRLVEATTRITVDEDEVCAASLALTELEETHARRRAVATETLSAGD